MKNFYKTSGQLPGFTKRSYQKISEDMDYKMSLTELVHDAIEHGHADKIVVKHIEENGKENIEVFNNGDPFEPEDFKEFAKQYQYHNPKNSAKTSNGGTVGQFGVGGKDACLALSDKNGTNIRIRNYMPNGKYQEFIWHVDKNNPDNDWYTAPEDIQVYDYDIEHQIPGVKFIIEGAIKVTRTKMQSSVDYFKKAISSERLKNDITIQFNWYGELVTVNCFDPMHFKDLEKLLNGKTIYTCKDGEYYEKHIMWRVKTQSFKINGEKIPRKVRVITEFILRDGYLKESKIDTVTTPDSGVYILKGGFYIEAGRDSEGLFYKHYGTGDNDGGGTPGYRQCIIVDGIEDIFHIKSSKISGVEPFKDNIDLNDNSKSIDYINGKIISIYTFLKSEKSLIKSYYTEVLQNSKKRHYSSYNYKEYGFEDVENAKKEFNNFLNKINRINSENKIQGYHIDASEKSCYAVNKKGSVISRWYDSDKCEWVTKLNNNAMFAIDEVPVEKVFSAIADLLCEEKMNPKLFQKIFGPDLIEKLKC